MQVYSQILIVDDVPEQIALAGAILRGEGYRVSAVTSGTAALKFLETHQPDLIMLDIKMEDMDGLEVCRNIRLNSDTRDIPIIFLTAQSSSAVIQRCFELGGSDYVEKPFVREELLARVKAQLENSRQRFALAQANQELRMFCSAVSHDLKSPLSVIRMLTEMLRQEVEGNASAIEIMDMITDKTDRLTKMIERLLEFSKMCNVTPDKEPLDMENIIRDTFAEIIMTVPDRRITLICDPIPEIWGDAVLVRMLVQNLLSNAVKFTQKREDACITVTCDQDGEYRVVTFRDNGAGFDMAYADKLFRIFQRLHTEEEFEGTGVGLALCDRIMKRHGGYIRAEGKPDMGAAFSLYFYNGRRT